MSDLSRYIDYVNWSKQAREAYFRDIEIPEKVTVQGTTIQYDREFRGYVITGMGGSGIVGDIVRDYLAQIVDKPVLVVKDVQLPRYVTQDYLVIAISYSGNTTETLSCFRQCIERKIPVIAVSTGGKLLEESRKYGTPHVSTPKATAPRYGLPGLLYTTLRVIYHFERDARQKIEQDVQDSISMINSAFKQYVESYYMLADKFVNRFTMVYVPQPLIAVGIRFKNDMNENAKHVVAVCPIPESEHNDLAVHVRKIENLQILIVKSNILKDTDYGKHIEAVKRVLQDFNQEFVVLELQGRSLLSEIMYGVTILGMLSLDVAYRIGVDPVKIEAIDRVKKYVSG